MHVVPLLKRSGLDPNVLENYRPISLTTVASKLLELILQDELQLMFKPHALQFGSVAHRNTGLASLLALETFQWHVCRGAPVFAANLDVRQCFLRFGTSGVARGWPGWPKPPQSNS